MDTLFRKIRLDDPEFRITLRFEDQQKLTIGAQVYVEILIYFKQFITEFFSFVAKVTHDEKPSEQTFTIHYLPHYPETKEFMISEDIVRKIDERFDEIEREKRNEVFMLPTRDNRAVRVSSDLLRATCEVINAQYSTGIGSRRIRNTYDTSSYSYRAVQLFVSGLLDEAQLEELDLNTLFEIYELYGELECIIEEFGFELNQYLLENIHKIDNLEEAVENVLYQQPVNEYTSRFRAQLRWLLSQIRGEYPFTEQDYHQFVRYKMNVERSINYQKKLELSRRYPIEITLLKRVYYYLYVRDYANLQSLYRENLDVWMNHFYNALGALLPDILVKDYRFQVTKITIRVGKQWKLENGPELKYTIEFDPELLGDAEPDDSEDEESAEEESDEDSEDDD